MSSQPADLNCTTSPWELKSNSDISGKGILTGFAASAYSTLLLCVAYYLVDHKRASNPVDRYFIDEFYRFYNKSRPSEKWTKTLEAAVLTFSDQQVITGIAILISGYSQLRGGLAVYYWQLIVDLAWFSSITHLTTLTCLRYYFQQRQGLRILRLICMAVTAGMLSCALASTGYLGGYDFSYDYPAWCLFHRTLMNTVTEHPTDSDDWRGYYNRDYVALVLLFLFVSYSTRIIQLFPSDLKKLRENGPAWLSIFALKKMLLKFKDRALDNIFPNYWALLYVLTMAIYCIFKATADLYSSMLWEITWLATALAWGSIRIIMDRNVNFDFQRSDPGWPYSSEDVHTAVLEDDVWGYGQVVTVALLLAPLVLFFESIYENVIMGEETTSTSTSSVPSSGSSSAEPWPNLYECAWFHSLVWLIYLQSLATAANVLVEFPLADGSYDLKSDIGFFFEFYLAWLGFDLAILLLFTITSLSLCHAQDTSEFRWTWMAKMRANWRPSKRTKLIQRVLLIVSVLILTALSAFFGWGVNFSIIPFLGE